MNQDVFNEQEDRDIPPRAPGAESEQLPPLPATEARATGRSMREAFACEFGPAERHGGMFGVIDTLLKRPSRITYEITHDRQTGASAALWAISAVCMAVYGSIVGMFSGGPQLWLVPLKVTLGFFLSALICLPSLYIFAALAGGRQSLGQACALLMQSVALSALLLLGFAPVAWVFTQSTRTEVFMGALHPVFWAVGTYFGLRLLKTAFIFLNGRHMGILRLWGCVFVAVALQMCAALRPLVGQFQGFRLQGRKFFVAHWIASVREMQSGGPDSGEKR